MHSFERQMARCLEAGEDATLEMFGGESGLAAAVNELGPSPLLPDFVRLALKGATPSFRVTSSLADFVCGTLDIAQDGFVLTEVIDQLGEGDLLSAPHDDRVLRRLLVIANDRGYEPAARSAALDGCFRHALTHRKHQLRLLSLLLDLSVDDDPAFLARAAKIAGVAYCHWREPDLIDKLSALVALAGVADEAMFELGMARLAKGLEGKTPQEATESLVAAKHWFSLSAAAREERPDAAAYGRCVDVLLAFSKGEGPAHLDRIASDLGLDAFRMRAWHATSSDPPWLGARQAEGAYWETLATVLSGLSKHLDERAWWEPAMVIEQYVVAAYMAGRSVLRRTEGLEALVRPRITSSIAGREGQACQLRKWLELNADHEFEEPIRELAVKVDAIVRGDPHPMGAATVWQPVAALLDDASVPRSLGDAARGAIASAQNLHFNNLTAAEIELLEGSLNAVRACPDYETNAKGRILFQAVLLWTLRFLSSRLELSRKDAPVVGYLFESEDGTLPHERKLQEDFFNVAYSNVAGTEIEVGNVGSGRADVRFSLGGERLVVEVKREEKDASFAGLKQAYAAQATDYQNVSVRLGILLVLDQSGGPRTGGTPHMSTLVETSSVVRRGESEPRWLVIVVVPGRRLVPSELSKVAHQIATSDSPGRPDRRKKRGPST